MRKFLAERIIVLVLVAVGFTSLFLSGCNQTGQQPVTFRQPSQQQTQALPPQGVQAAVPTVYGQQNLYGSAKIGMILPLSGRLASVGNAMRNAALMAQSDSNAPDMFLDFYDSQSNDNGAAQAASSALSKGSNLILGPLRGSSIATVSSIANGYGVNVVSFSNDMTQAQPGAYVMGVAPSSTIPRLFQYAASQGKSRIAVLAPNEVYGLTAARIADQTAYQYGVQVVDSRFYDPSSQGAESRGDTVKSFAGSFGSYDAILIPDGGLRLREIVSLLHFHKVNPQTTKYMGTRLWDDPSLTNEAALNNGWFASTPDAQWKSFSTQYKRQFGQEPPRPAALAYDAVRMAATLGANGYGFDQSALTQPAGFAGIEGTFRFLTDGSSQRQLEIKEITKQGIVVREAANGSFDTGTGF
jgi:branched-chain amino acid transport system substrate-binding protein